MLTLGALALIARLGGSVPMSKPVITRRPHGPINPRFSLMWFDFATGKVRFDLPSRPIKHAWNGGTPATEAAA